MQEPASTVKQTFPCVMIENDEGYLAGPAWPHTHTLDLARMLPICNLMDMSVSNLCR